MSVCPGATAAIASRVSGSTSDFLVTQDTFGFADQSEEFDHFGWALAAGDFNADGLGDLDIDLAVDIGLVRSDVTFADVGGMDDVKEEVRIKILAPVQHPELF